MKSFPFYVLLFIILCIGCTEDELTDPNYPTTINPISKQELNLLSDEVWESQIGNCTAIDTLFGYLFSTIDNEVCIDSSWRANFTYAELEAIAADAVARYASFLHVADPTEFEVNDIRELEGLDYNSFLAANPDSLPWFWIVRSKPQIYEGMEVRGTYLTVVISPQGAASVGGIWYNTIYVPLSDSISEEKAKENLMGKTLTYSSSKLTIGNSTSWSNSKKLIVPLKQADKIELRVCWALRPGNWEVLIDTQTGEQISTISIGKI